MKQIFGDYKLVICILVTGELEFFDLREYCHENAEN